MVSFFYIYVVDSIRMLLKITVKHCRKIIPNIGDISIPNIMGIVPRKSLKYGSVKRFNEQNGSLYQFTVGNQAKDNFNRINIRYISEKFAIDVNIKLNDLLIIFIFLFFTKFIINTLLTYL